MELYAGLEIKDNNNNNNNNNMYSVVPYGPITVAAQSKA
jgi:hypothetical protein